MEDNPQDNDNLEDEDDPEDKDNPEKERALEDQDKLEKKPVLEGTSSLHNRVIVLYEGWLKSNACFSWKIGTLALSFYWIMTSKIICNWELVLFLPEMIVYGTLKNTKLRVEWPN